MSETACGSRERDATRRMETPPRAPSTDPSSSHPPTDSAFSEVELRRLEEERKAVRELYVREAEAKRAEKAAREREFAAALDTMDRDRRERAEAYRLESLAKKMSLERRADDPNSTATATGSTSGSAPAFTPEDLRRLDEERKARQRAYADEARALRRGATRGANTSPSSSNPTTPVSQHPASVSWSRETREETHPGTRPETTTPVPDPNSDESRPSRPEASPRPEAASRVPRRRPRVPSHPRHRRARRLERRETRTRRRRRMRNFIAKRTRGRRSMRLTDWWDTVTCLGLPEAPFESERGRRARRWRRRGWRCRRPRRSRDCGGCCCDGIPINSPRDTGEGSWVGRRGNGSCRGCARCRTR